MLSHHSFGGEYSFSLRSRRRDWIQSNFAAVFATDLYSSSVDDWETVGCFLEHHEIKSEPRKTQ
jgi:hypothetical protein